MTEEVSFSYDCHTFPFHSDCYTWPRVAVYDEDGAIELHVHCICDVKRKEFSLMGFIGADREDQISQVIFMAKEIGGEVIMFKGVGFTDEMIGILMARMVEPLPDEFSGHKVSLLRTDWPTRFQRRILREAMDMCRHGDFQETSLAYRMHASVEEIRKHLQLLTDLGLMTEEQ